MRTWRTGSVVGQGREVKGFLTFEVVMAGAVIAAAPFRVLVSARGRRILTSAGLFHPVIPAPGVRPRSLLTLITRG
jgi:hypothetical protein